MWSFICGTFLGLFSNLLFLALAKTKNVAVGDMKVLVQVALNRFYLAELIKLLVTSSMFVLVFKFTKIDVGFFLAGFVIMQTMIWRRICRYFL